MHITTTLHVKAPIEKVFDAFSDLERAPERIRGIKKIELLTQGPMQVGTRWRETRVMFKREATEVMTITSFERNKHYTAGASSCGCEYETNFRFRPNGAGTDVEMEMRARPVSFFAKLMSPLAKLMAGAAKKCFDKDLEDLRTHIESQHAGRN